MATVNYGLSPEGFKRKRLPEIIESLNNRVADKLGVPIQTGANSLFGQLHGVYGYEIANLWELAENVYNAMYPNTAQGTSLSDAAGLAGIRLITAEQTILKATCYGTENTTIPYGAQISSSEHPAMIFFCNETMAKITKSAADIVRCIIPANVSVGVQYSLTIDGVQKLYKAVSGDTKAMVFSALASQFSFTDRTLTINNDTLTISMDDMTKTFAVSTSANITIDLLGSPVEFVSETSGAVAPAIGELTNIITAYTGWDSVSNEAEAIVGRDNETDIALRQRWNSSVYDRASAMVEAIQAAIYAQVTGVFSCTVYENDSDLVDADGRPPHSIEAVVDGGDPQEIAKVIWRTKAGGIDTFGDVSETVMDSQGIQHVMHFNRPEEIKVWMKVTLAENPDEEISAAAESEVAAAILAKGQTQKVGEDVILQRYFAAIFASTVGIGYINITAATGDPAGAYSANNIVINPRQIAIFDASRIEVTMA